jgi:hypothetical protein
VVRSPSTTFVSTSAAASLLAPLLAERSGQRSLVPLFTKILAVAER